MARPTKQTVDYFPHYCNHKKTMFIIEQKYGNDGYAFWFKLLEMLGSTDGHVLHLENPADWEFLQAKTRLSDSFCTEILDLLASLAAIDADLWQQKIVWSDHFVANIADVYKNRRVEIPAKPSFYSQKPSCAVVSTEEKPQSKLKETKLKETILKHTYAPLVMLTETEHQKLLDQFGEAGTADRIERLSLYKGSTGKKYASDYLTILNWARKDDKRGDSGQVGDRQSKYAAYNEGIG